RQRRTRFTSRSIGFSQKIALPARAKRSIRSAWVSVGVQMTTASISPAASISARLRTSAPCSAASAVPAGATASATAVSRACGSDEMARACTLPMRPAPRRPNLIVIACAPFRPSFRVGPGDVLIEIDDGAGHHARCRPEKIGDEPRDMHRLYEHAEGLGRLGTVEPVIAAAVIAALYDILAGRVHPAAVDAVDADPLTAKRLRGIARDIGERGL